jgi:hypothetical protein
MPDLTTSAAAESGPQAYQMASLGPKDMDVVMLYDAFTINTVLFLEDLGFWGVLSSQDTAVLGSEEAL